jgi:hypothetical protein
LDQTSAHAAVRALPVDIEHVASYEVDAQIGPYVPKRCQLVRISDPSGYVDESEPSETGATPAPTATLESAYDSDERCA